MASIQADSLTPRGGGASRLPPRMLPIMPPHLPVADFLHEFRGTAAIAQTPPPRDPKPLPANDGASDASEPPARSTHGPPTTSPSDGAKPASPRTPKTDSAPRQKDPPPSDAPQGANVEGGQPAANTQDDDTEVLAKKTEEHAETKESSEAVTVAAVAVPQARPDTVEETHSEESSPVPSSAEAKTKAAHQDASRKEAVPVEDIDRSIDGVPDRVEPTTKGASSKPTRDQRILPESSPAAADERAPDSTEIAFGESDRRHASEPDQPQGQTAGDSPTKARSGTQQLVAGQPVVSTVAGDAPAPAADLARVHERRPPRRSGEGVSSPTVATPTPDAIPAPPAPTPGPPTAAPVVVPSAAPNTSPVASPPSTQTDVAPVRGGLPDHLISRGPRKPVEGPALSPADHQRFLQRVTKALDMARHRDGEVRLRLSPPELGSLRLELRVDHGAVSARIEADNASARHLLLDNLPVLRDRLEQQGLRVEQFDVDLTPRHDQQAMPDGRDAQPHEPRPRRNGNASSATPSTAADESDRPGAPYPLLGGNQSINVII